MGIVAVVLAAGASRRLGSAKQLVSHRGRALVRAAAEEALASACERVIVVVGARENEVRAALAGLPIGVAVNAAWEEGLASSIRCGVERAMREGGDACEAVVLLVCDQPALTAAHVDRLVESFRREGAVVASAYGGTLGVPALFPRDTFAALLALTGNEGAKRVIQARAAVAVDWPEGAVDVDTPGDLLALLGVLLTCG